jgi:ribosomal protein L10
LSRTRWLRAPSRARTTSASRTRLTGPLLYAFSQEDPGAAGRLIKEFAKGNDKLQAKVVSMGGKLYPGVAPWT